MDYLLGVVVSLLVEGIKRIFGTDTFMTHLVLLVASLFGAALYVYFSHSSLWPSMLQVLVSAAAFHNLVIRKFESDTTTANI